MDQREQEDEIRQFTRKLERELARLRHEQKQKLRVYMASMIVIVVLILSATIMIMFPAVQGTALIVSGSCSILLSVINFFQFIGALKWSKRWSMVLLAVCLMNMVLGITKFI